MTEEHQLSNAIAVNKQIAEKVRKILSKNSLLAKRLRTKRSGDLVLFPVIDVEQASRILKEKRLPHMTIKDRFKVATKPSRLQGQIRSYKAVGDIVVFSSRSGIPLESYIEAARKLLKENPRFKSAWLKTETFGDLRIPKLIHLMGERRTKTIVKEYGVRLAVDMVRAYYNPRLAGEHYRIAEMVRNGETVLDMFTGVGGFAIHIIKRKRAVVYGIDVNMDALHLALESAKLNKNLKGLLVLINANAEKPPFTGSFDRIIMNLPKDSIRFLTHACNYVRSGGVIHIYMLHSDKDEVVLEVKRHLLESGCTPIVQRRKPVLDYSPKQSIYALDVRVEKHGDYG